MHVVFQMLLAYVSSNARSRHEPERAPRQQGSGSRSQHSFQVQAGPIVVSSQRNYSSFSSFEHLQCNTHSVGTDLTQ